MNGKELQALRKILMLDASEAAELVGGVSTRSWQYWESGKYAVPPDVDTGIETLMQKRAERIEAIEKSIDHLPLDQWQDNLELDYHQRFVDYQAVNPSATQIDWRIDQCVAAYFFADNFARLK